MVILPDFKSPADINKRKTQTYASTKPKGHKLDVTKITVLFIAKSHSISDPFYYIFLFTFLITRFIKIDFIPILQEYRHFLHNIRLANNLVKRYLLFFLYFVFSLMFMFLFEGTYESGLYLLCFAGLILSSCSYFMT